MGYLIVMEYVGACYLSYPDKQVQILNKLLKCFPQELRAPDMPETFQSHSIREALKSHDPSEGVRSKLIIPFLQSYFNFEILRPFGGGVLHPLYPFLNDQKLQNSTIECQTIVRLLIAFERILIDYGFESDFLFAIGHPKSLS